MLPSGELITTFTAAYGDESAEQLSLFSRFSSNVLRLFNSETGVHLYSTDITEYTMLSSGLEPNWNGEGAAWNQIGDTQVYRFFNSTTGSHFYTADVAERDHIMNNLPNFSYEGAAFTVSGVADSQTVALHRFFNTETGSHFYTASEAERESVSSSLPQFKYEGIMGYVDPV